MARHITNAGAFYAFISRGLGHPAGVGAALVAVAAYNLLQVGLYGAFGPGLRDYAAGKFNVHAPWWAWALMAWLIVTTLGLLRVDLNGKVLAVLLSFEIVVVMALTIGGLFHPAAGLNVSTLSPHPLFASGIGAALVIAVLGFVGFEGAVVFSEEARHPRRTVPTATYLSLGCIAVVYATAAWSMSVHYGVDKVVASAQQLGPACCSPLAIRCFPTWGDVLLDLAVRGRAGVPLLRHALHVRARPGGRVAKEPGAYRGEWQPQGGIKHPERDWPGGDRGLRRAGARPARQAVFWLGTSGGFGILVLIAETSIAVIGFFARHASGEPAWHRIVAPGVASVLLVVMVYLAVTNYATLLGVPPGHPAASVPGRGVGRHGVGLHAEGPQARGVQGHRPGSRRRDRAGQAACLTSTGRGAAMTMDVKIRRADMSDIPKLAQTMAAAFQHDPVSMWLMPDPDDRARRHPAFFRIFIFLEHAIVWGEVHTTHEFEGVALWLERRDTVR
jgi:hypothetical protein